MPDHEKNHLQQQIETGGIGRLNFSLLFQDVFRYPIRQGIGLLSGQK